MVVGFERTEKSVRCKHEHSTCPGATEQQGPTNVCLLLSQLHPWELLALQTPHDSPAHIQRVSFCFCQTQPAGRQWQMCESD